MTLNIHTIIMNMYQIDHSKDPARNIGSLVARHKRLEKREKAKQRLLDILEERAREAEEEANPKQVSNGSGEEKDGEKVCALVNLESLIPMHVS